jgi:hypothetical protein
MQSNKIIPYLLTAKAKPAYQLFLVYEDGVNGTIDLSEWKGKGVFDYWNNEKNFEQFFITPQKKLQWCEDIDMDPDAFYLQLIGKTFSEYGTLISINE